MSVVFHHPLPTSCAPAAHSHPSGAHPPQQRRCPGMHLPPPGAGGPSLSPCSSSSSRAKFPHFPLRCIFRRPEPAVAEPITTAPSRRLPSSTHPYFSKKGPFFAVQPCRRSSGDGGASTVARCTRPPASSSTFSYDVPDGAITVWGPRAGVSPLQRRLLEHSISRLAAAAGRPSNSKKEDKLVTEGLITELLPNCMFRVRLDNGEVILGYVSGKMRTKMVRVLVGDRVKIEVSRYDSTRGRIVYRLRSKTSTD